MIGVQIMVQEMPVVKGRIFLENLRLLATKMKRTDHVLAPDLNRILVLKTVLMNLKVAMKTAEVQTKKTTITMTKDRALTLGHRPTMINQEATIPDRAAVWHQNSDKRMKKWTMRLKAGTGMQLQRLPDLLAKVKKTASKHHRSHNQMVRVNTQMKTVLVPIVGRAGQEVLVAPLATTVLHRLPRRRVKTWKNETNIARKLTLWSSLFFPMKSIRLMQ
mmetsp:Transcript_56753/g.138056  ORF Transcript_56753/g.138056 Transcript_56753/m.138056 type:complete len:218 (-) Transcript_56753:3177-3830(-)